MRTTELAGRHTIHNVTSSGGTHPGSNIGVYPVLVVLGLLPCKGGQDGDEGGEVEEGGAGCEPKLLQYCF